MLRKYSAKAPVGSSDEPTLKQASAAPKQYSIVGTWDDWEPHGMTWNAKMMCFEHIVTIGRDGCESFKFVQDEDWDLCVHPGRRNAFPGDGHKPLGPEDGGLETEWTIGYRPADQASEGSHFQVRLFLLPDGLPKRVEWSLLTAEEPSRAKTSSDPVRSEASRAARADTEPRPEPTEPEERRPKEAWRGTTLEADERQVVLDYEPITREAESRRPVRESPQQRQLGEEVAQRERVARQRLSERFDAALAVPDNGSASQRAEELAFKLARNRRRYDSADDSGSLIDPGYATKSSTRSSLTRQGHGVCVECGKQTAEFWSFGSHCCQVCMEDFNALVKEGWKGDILIDGTSAHDRARKLQQEFAWTAQESRIAVMRLFHHMFRPGAVQTPATKPAGLQKCVQCSGVALGGQCTNDGSAYCPRCWASRGAQTPQN